MFQDFKELLSEFNDHHVRYLVVGGYAVSYHGQPRGTKDLDVLIGPDAINRKAVFAALVKFGAPVSGLTDRDFADPESFFRMGTPPVMVDILAKIKGVDFESAWARRVSVSIDGELSAPFISSEDLVASKIAAGRPQDLADVASLRDAAHQRVASGSQSLEDMRAEGRENWLRYRQTAQIQSSGEVSEAQSGKALRNLDDPGQGPDDDLSP